jgi:kumamolisin
MPAGSERAEVPGSARSADPGHARVGDVDPQASVEVSVYVRPRAGLDWVDAEAERAPDERRYTSREQWAAEQGADPADLQAVESFARESGQTVLGADPARRVVQLSGTAEQVAGAFGARLEGMYRPAEDAEPYRARSGPLSVPAALADVVTGVFGIDNRPQARTHLRRAAASANISYTPVQVAEACDFPAGAGGQGQAVGIIELGGGFATSDLSTYFSGLGLSNPSVTAVSVDGGQNQLGQDTNADGEVMLDIEVVGATANQAAIAVYFAPNTDQGFVDALSTAVHDTTHKPSVISVSWGQSEDSYSTQTRNQMEQILTEAAALGVTVTVAAGDNGSTDSVTDGQQPASAPHALACGGTSLQASGATISSEVTWNDTGGGSGGSGGGGVTGGGVSRQFPLPSYQANAKVPVNVDSKAPGRGVPDMAGDADPATGYQVRVDGAEQVIGGTSAVAPLWAGLIARLGQELGAPVGFLQPRLYALLGTSAFHDVTSGDNGAYQAGPGWDACTGLGSPDGAALAAALRGGTGAPSRGVRRGSGWWKPRDSAAVRPQAAAQAGGTRNGAPDGGPHRLLAAGQDELAAGPGDRGVEQLPGEDARLGVGEQHRRGVELGALALVDGHCVHGLVGAQAGRAVAGHAAPALEGGQRPV